MTILVTIFLKEKKKIIKKLLLVSLLNQPVAATINNAKQTFLDWLLSRKITSTATLQESYIKCKQAICVTDITQHIEEYWYQVMVLRFGLQDVV